MKSGLPQQPKDQERIAELIEEASKGGRYYLHQRRKQQQLLVRIEKLKSKLAFASNNDKSRAERHISNVTKELQKNKFEGRCFVHVDLDAFFASVEERDHPEWRGKPLAVGDKHMLCTANYEARKYGASAAMPGYIALKLCPQIILAPHRMHAYREAGQQSREIFALYDPNFQSFSLDEASMELTDYLKVHPTESPEDVVSEIRRKVTAATNGLTCSAGIARNRFLAKLASNVNKPNGQFLIPLHEDPQEFILSKLPIRKLWGVGKVTAALLKGVLDVDTCAELWEVRHQLPLFLTPILTRNLLRSLLGLSSEEDPHIIENDDDLASRSSRSVERTFEAIYGPKLSEIRCMFEKLAQDLIDDLQKEGITKVSNIGIKVKTADFDVFTRSQPFPIAISINESTPIDTFVEPAMLLFKRLRPESIRLLGLKTFKLTFKGQTELEDETQKIHKLRMGVMDDFIKPMDSSGPQCPVCLSVLPEETTNQQLNEHVDRCLINPCSTISSKTASSSSSSSSPSKYKTPRHREKIKKAKQGMGPMDKFLQKPPSS